MRVLLAFAISAFLCLGLSQPAFGNHNTWIEICSEQGAEMVLVDLDEGTPQKSECAHCEICLINTSGSNGLTQYHRAFAIDAHFEPAPVVPEHFTQPTIRTGAALSRGPPRESSQQMPLDTNMRAPLRAGSVPL